MNNEQFSRGAGGYGSGLVATRLGWLYPPSPTLNTIPEKKLKEIRDQLFQPGGIVLNVGSGERTGCGKRLWDSRSEKNLIIVNMDIGGSPSNTVQGDIMKMPFGENSFDAVVCQAVLEHVSDSRLAVSELLRVLKPNGLVYAEVPFMQGFHADPHDYSRYTIPGLKNLFSAFSCIDCDVSVGPWSVIVWWCREYFSSCFTNRLLFLASRFLLGWILAPLRYLDYLPLPRRGMTRLASEYYYFGKK